MYQVLVRCEVTAQYMWHFAHNEVLCPAEFTYQVLSSEIGEVDGNTLPVRNVYGLAAIMLHKL